MFYVWRDRAISRRNIFGIIFQDRLFFKPDEESRKGYVAYEMDPFQFNEKQKIKTYYEVPVVVIENRESLVTWAMTAVKIAENKGTK